MEKDLGKYHFSAPQSSFWSSYKHSRFVAAFIHSCHARSPLGALAPRGQWGQAVSHGGLLWAPRTVLACVSLAHKNIPCHSWAATSWMQQHWHQLRGAAAGSYYCQWRRDRQQNMFFFIHLSFSLKLYQHFSCFILFWSILRMLACETGLNSLLIFRTWQIRYIQSIFPPSPLTLSDLF